MDKLFALLIVLPLMGCMERKASMHTDRVGDYQVEKVFTHEGVTMYRFNDGIRTIYYGVKQDGSVKTHHETSNGKTITHHDTEVITKGEK